MTQRPSEPPTADQIAAALHAQFGNATPAGPLDTRASRGEPPAAPAADREPAPSIDYRRTLAFFRWYEGLLRAHRAAAEAVAEHNLAADDPALRGDDDVTRRAVHAIHLALLHHPVAAKAMFAALVAEGRRFSQTADGAALLARLAASRRVQRWTVLWRSITLGLLDDASTNALPTMYVDALIQLVDDPDLEGVLGRMLAELEGAR